VADYTKLTASEAGEILALYGLDREHQLTPLSLGISNSNYKIEVSGKSYLLKVSNDKNKDELQEEQDILALLKKNGYPYSLKPFRCLNGEIVYQLENFIGVLYPFVEGIPPGPSDSTCFEIGAALGKLHKLNTTGQENQIRSYSNVGFGPREILKYIDGPNAEKKYIEKFFEVFPDKLQTLRDTDFPCGVIHGDLYYDNTLFKNDHLTAVLDFEQAGWGEYLLDLGISISGTCLEKGRIIHPLIASYIKGYESERVLTETEKKHLNDVIILGLFSISLWRIKRFTEGDLNPLMANSYEELLLRACAFKELLESGNSQ